MPKSWNPLESNPEVISTFARKLGLDQSLCYIDIFSTEEWALEMIPKPVYAVLLLFPVKESTELFLLEERNRIEKEGQILSENVYFTKQIVGNACGTIAVLHASMNLRDKYKPSSYFDRFYNSTCNMNADERAKFLEDDDEIEVNHVSAAELGQSDQIAPDAIVNNHFICFSNVDNHIYELDGRKQFPINHGPTTEDSFLADIAQIVVKFMERDPGELQFTMMALCPNPME